MSRRVLIMGAAGRDFHNFNVAYRGDRRYEVVAFTATQIPFIDERRYPPSLAGERYPNGIAIHDESELTKQPDRNAAPRRNLGEWHSGRAPRAADVGNGQRFARLSRQARRRSISAVPR